MAIRISIDTKRVKKRVHNINIAMGAHAVNRVVRRVADISRGRLIRVTPKKWTGNTRRGWQVKKRDTGHYMIYNETKVMRFLEFGTRAHGPKKAKYLFIPLTKRAFNKGARGVYLANKQRKLEQALGARGGKALPFKFGRDFALARRVRGIKPRRIVRDYAPFALQTLKNSMRLHIRRALGS